MKLEKTEKFNKLAILFSSLLLGVFIAEVLLRILPQKITKLDYSLLEEERIFTPTRSFKFRPNLTRVWVSLGRPTVWHFNELGYRERSIQIKKPENIFRIVFVGDSVVMGFGVEDFEAFPRQLERLLKPRKFHKDMVHFEVLNLGIQGYSTPDYLDVIKRDVLKLDPDLVIVGLYPNDPPEAANFQADKKYIKLRSIPDTMPYKLSKLLKNYSRLYLLLLNRYYSFIERYQVEFKHTKESQDYELGLIRDDIIEIKKILNQNSINFVLLGIPHPKSEVFSESPDYSRLEKLKKLSKERNIIYFNLLKGLRSYPKVAGLYIDNLDDHFTPEGNRYVAELIAEFLLKQNLVPHQPK